MPPTDNNAENLVLVYALASPGVETADLRALGPYLVALMLRNVASSGFVFEHPPGSGRLSVPGCILASPSYPAFLPGVDQDYVFNWTRDAAITAIEIAAADLPRLTGGQRNLIDYVNFARRCADNARPTLAHAAFTIDGEARPNWSEQTDGPALQTLALFAAYDLLDPLTQDVARDLMRRNVDFLLGVYQSKTKNIWEEKDGYSFFARAAQLRCLRAVAANVIGLPVPDGLRYAADWLEAALAGHWNGSFYVSVSTSDGPNPAPVVSGYDPNIDIVCAAIYGAIPVTDPKLLATAGLLRRQWSDPASPNFYPINGADAARGLGPLLGRYPGDDYDGDVAHPVTGGHPWAVCTANMAELYFRLAASLATDAAILAAPLAAPFFADFGVSPATPPADAAQALRAAGDAMLRAILFHSDSYELSEQFDGATGFEKSVRNLSWSYAAVLSALRART
jgi:glucoamylase